MIHSCNSSEALECCVHLADRTRRQGELNLKPEDAAGNATNRHTLSDVMAASPPAHHPPTVWGP